MKNLNRKKLRLIIKLPVNGNGKFKLQSRGNIVGKQYKTAAGLLDGISSVFLRTESKKKIEMVVRGYIDGHFENINETLLSDDREYLLYCATCFLEDFISKAMLRKAEKRYEKNY